MSSVDYLCEYQTSALTVFVIGASGDLAKKKVLYLSYINQ